ncbi:hypothetical protein [Hymenobacter lapidiphilus]|uniref:Uncharacterized protein n=1 Tax=Hymenobacter lapidiphilus TaxID=2608003 RepID=A0A7Y7PT36_9BACT|nr:hypothetical protein [Hymenobacter lapidiphilus]NVO33516.1 hypothetical protein [Hymenobacter lapidiphilus]
MEDQLIAATVDLINARVSEFLHLEVDIHSFGDTRLTLAVGEDLLYYSNFKVVFEDVFMLSLNASSFIKTQGPWLSVVTAEAVAVNRQFRVETGNTLFQLHNSDQIPFYVAATGIRYLPEGEKHGLYH